MTCSHLRADCLYTGISSGLNARQRVCEAFTFTFYTSVTRGTLQSHAVTLSHPLINHAVTLPHLRINTACNGQILDNFYMSSAAETPTLNSGGRGRSGTKGGRSPGCFFWVLPKRGIPKPDQHIKDIIQQESLGTNMLKELKNSNYTRYCIELINRFCGDWLVSTR